MPDKAGLLIEILKRVKLLLVFDNYEDVLPSGQAVSRAALETETGQQEQDGQGTLDPDLPLLMAMLVGGVTSVRPNPRQVSGSMAVNFRQYLTPKQILFRPSKVSQANIFFPFLQLFSVLPTCLMISIILLHIETVFQALTNPLFGIMV